MIYYAWACNSQALNKEGRSSVVEVIWNTHEALHGRTLSKICNGWWSGVWLISKVSRARASPRTCRVKEAGCGVGWIWVKRTRSIKSARRKYALAGKHSVRTQKMALLWQPLGCNSVIYGHVQRLAADAMFEGTAPTPTSNCTQIRTARTLVLWLTYNSFSKHDGTVKLGSD